MCCKLRCDRVSIASEFPLALCQSASLTLIVSVRAAIGLPAPSVVMIKYFWLKERELVNWP